jgi:hypothetical protein
MKARWREILGGIIALGVLAAVTPALVDGPTVGGHEIAEVSGTIGGGMDRLVTDTVVRVVELMAVVLLASVTGGLVTGLLYGRFVSRSTRWAAGSWRRASRR